MDDKIERLEQMINVLARLNILIEEMPDSLWSELENNPEKIPGYHDSISKAYKTSSEVMFAFMDISIAFIAKYGSAAEHEKLLQDFGAKADRKEFMQLVKECQKATSSELRQVIKQHKEVNKLKRELN